MMNTQTHVFEAEQTYLDEQLPKTMVKVGNIHPRRTLHDRTLLFSWKQRRKPLAAKNLVGDWLQLPERHLKTKTLWRDRVVKDRETQIALSKIEFSV